MVRLEWSVPVKPAWLSHMIGERTRRIVPPNYRPLSEDTSQEIVTPRSHDQSYHLITQVLLLLLSLLYPGEFPLILWGPLLDFCWLLDPWSIVAVLVLSISGYQYFCLWITWPFKQRSCCAERVPALPSNPNRDSPTSDLDSCKELILFYRQIKVASTLEKRKS